MVHEELDFLRQGLRYYPEAKETVTRFSDLVVQSLKQGLKRWPEMAKPSVGQGFNDGEHYIEVWQEVRLRKVKSVVSIGLAWQETEPYLYVYCGHGPDWATRATGPGFEESESGNMLKRPLTSKDLDFNEEVRELLDEWEAAVQASQAKA